MTILEMDAGNDFVRARPRVFNGCPKRGHCEDTAARCLHFAIGASDSRMENLNIFELRGLFET